MIISLKKALSPIKTNSPNIALLLILMLSTDIAFVAGHLLYKFYSPLSSAHTLDLELDRGYPEMFQYANFFGCFNN